LVAFGSILWLIGGAALTWLFISTNEQTLYRRIDSQADAIAGALQNWASEANFDPQRLDIISRLKHSAPQSDAVRQYINRNLRSLADAAEQPLLLVRIYDDAGQLVYSTDSRAGQTSPQAPEASAGLVDQQTYVFLERTLTTRQAYGRMMPLGAHGWVEVHTDLQHELSALDSEAQRLMAGAILVLTILWGAILALTRPLASAARRLEGELIAAQASRREATTHLRHVQDAMDNTIAERTLRLQQSEARFREFAESASDWLWECDDQGRITYLSEGFSRIMAVERNMVLGRYRWELSDSPDDDEKWASHRDIMTSMRPFRDFTYTFRLGAERRRVVSLSGTPIFDEQARFRGFRGTGSDVTAQFEAKQTILHLGRVLEQSSSELFIVDGDSLRILQANRGARRNLGYSSDELPQLSLLDILPTESRGSLNARVGRLRLYPAELATFETLQERKDGSRYPVETRIQFMAQEQPPVFVVVAQNITARKEAEQALAESEERYRSVAEMSLDAIIVHVDGIIVFANQQATVAFCVETPEALMGQSVSAFVRPKDHDMLRAVFFPPRESENTTLAPPKRTELTLIQADGNTFEAELSSLAITFGGRPAVQTVLRDITQSKAVGQLIQTAKLATLGEMAAGMAHELSQPMNVIRMAAEGAMLDASHGGTGDPASRAALEIIASQATRMGEIIDHMRIFSRKQSDEVAVFDPIPCVYEAVAMVESQLRAEDITLTVQCTLDHAAIQGRPVHLEQVLLNLLTNARDALRSQINSRPYGSDDSSDWRATITVTVALLTDPDSQDQELEIIVSDNGTGIPAEILDRIFEPFFTTKEVGTGTGLGLSVSFSLISSMHGTMEACNQPQRGAYFRILLPLAKGVEAAPPPPRTLPPMPPPALSEEHDEDFSALVGHVLVVDDEPFAASLVRDHLVRQGYRVSTAQDGEDAYEKVIDDPPDLIITDLRMPRCDGGELIRRVHALIPGLPVIVATGHLGHLETAATALQEVSVAVLKKPISLSHLSDLVKTHIDLP
jgi:PAS domain S-box-containing protein